MAFDQHQIAIGSRWGCCLQDLPQGATFSRRMLPCFELPPQPRDRIGLETMLVRAVQRVLAGQSLALISGDGVQRSSFLCELAHHPQVTTAYRDGLIYLNQAQPLPDLLHQLAQRFITTYPERRLTPSQLESQLASLQLVVMIDRPQWTVQQWKWVRSVMPATTWVFGLPEKLWGWDLEGLVLPRLSDSQVLAWICQSDDRSLLAKYEGVLLKVYHRLGLMQWVRLVAALVSQGLDPDKLSQLLDDPDPVVSLLERSLLPLGTPERWILAVLIALQGVGLSMDQIATITGPLNPQPSLRQLQQAQLVMQQGSRYAIVPEVAEVLGRDFNIQPWMKRVLAYVLPWAERYATYPDVLRSELDLLLCSFHWAVEAQLWPQVLQLAQALDNTLILSQQWERWERVLQGALQAARQLHQPMAEAWAWHQLGICALGQADLRVAYDALAQALRLQQQRSHPAHEMALALSQHNVDQVLQGITQIRRSATGERTPVRDPFDRRRVYGLLLLICLLTFGVSMLVGLALRPIFQSEIAPTVVPHQ